MAQSNAERQRSYRQRAAEALRAVRALADEGPGTPSVTPTPIPAAMWREGVEDVDAGHLTFEELRADIAVNAKTLWSLFGGMGLVADDLDIDPDGYVTLLGGREYLQEIQKWSEEVGHRRGERRREAKDRAPAVPGEKGIT